MNKSILLVSAIVIGLSFSACRNSKKSNDASEDLINKNLVSTAASGEYVPDEREQQFIYDGPFEIPEIYVAQSPDKEKAIKLKPSEKVISFDVSPSGLIVATVIKDQLKSYIKFWKIDQDDFFDTIILPDSIDPREIAWHPNINAFFIAAQTRDNYRIIRYDKGSTGWTSEDIYSSASEIRRLILCPRPFLIFYNRQLRKSLYSFRLFFGLRKDDGSYRIASVTEFGRKFYQVIGPSATFTHNDQDGMDPSQLRADWALPVTFHPSGQELIWENSDGEFFKAEYSSRAWASASKSLNTAIKGGQPALTPNGLGLLHWKNDIPGVMLYLFTKDEPYQLLRKKLLVAPPVPVPDGKGVVCLANSGGAQSLEYLLTDYPLADVVNSWMFAESQEDLNLLVGNYGMFRPTSYNQLYQLYESENYYCDNYDQSTPTRPYLVTTDIFWELYGSAFQGIFTVKERAQAIPSFWSFVHSAASFYRSKPDSPWAGVFQTLISLEQNDLGNPEVNNIMNASGKSYSDILRKEYDYSILKPLGIYTSTSQMQSYYRAFKYFTTVFENDKSIVLQLNGLPSETKENAFQWINSYQEFISKPRRQNVFQKEKFIPAKFIQDPDTGLSVFPLSWGLDNEILNSVVYHSDYPKERQVISTKGEWRLHPSGLDLAAAISSNFADSLLINEYREYPNLRPIIQNLRKSFQADPSSPERTLYDLWINALATQWIDTLKSTSGKKGDPLWQVKRLQTGLASWATLRHATVLVNETSAAECGEGGFEEILMRAPRGYVEPDPYTLESIARLFESSKRYLPADATNNELKSLYEGIAKNLQETADEIRFFKRIARKEIIGESLTNEEYEAILYVARVAEHKFLIFKSLANEKYGLANPDPMPKVTNVFGNTRTGYLMVSVGRPVEWDFIVPFFGRKQVVKGSAYSYYEFVNEKLIDDSDWIKQLPSSDYVPWVRPFISKQQLSYPPKCGF